MILQSGITIDIMYQLIFSRMSSPKAIGISVMTIVVTMYGQTPAAMTADSTAGTITKHLVRGISGGMDIGAGHKRLIR